MPTPTPADQASRDMVRNDLRRTLFVEAGAGTGKTTALVSRIVRLLATGQVTSPGLAAITFTEKAAAELRERVRRVLEKACGDEGGLPATELALCAAALADLDRAVICTLHAFAQHILMARPLEAGLPPLFSIQDDTPSSLAFGDRWDGWLDGFLNDSQNAPLVRLAVPLGLSLKELRQLAVHFHQNWDRLEALTVQGPQLPEVPTVQPMLDALADACSGLGQCRDPKDYMRQHLDRVNVYLRRLAAARTGAERLKVLADPQQLTHGRGRQPNWPAGMLNDIRQALQDATDERSQVLASLRSAIVPHIVAAVRGFAMEWAADRRHQGALQFHDLLVLARDLLRDHSDVRAAVSAQWRYLLIDEFQDTDPLQAEIAILLAGVEVDRAGWRQASVEPGRLFFVGDPKQSIYRFRRADVALYRSVQERFPDGQVKLTQSFRSQSTIIDWLNKTFGRLLQGGTDNVQAPYIPLVASRAVDEPRVTVLGGPQGSFDSIDELREAEAQDIVRAIQAVKNQGWPVVPAEAAEEVTRPARYADIALLIPTRTSLSALERALEGGGVPYRVESRSLVYASSEVQDLLAVLTAIDDPTDQVALVAALRSPMFACSDDDLLDFHQSGGRWDYTRRLPKSIPAGHVVAEAYRTLSELNRRRAWVGVAAVVEQVVREQGQFLLAFAHRRPRDVWNRLRFLVDQARSFQEQGGSTLRQFVEWVQQQADEDRAIVEMIVPEQDDDAVRIMTIHASKGLEFPVVFVAGLNVERQNRGLPPALWPAEGGVEVRLGPKERMFETPGFAAGEMQEGAHQVAEQHRLLYVACTRSRDHLVLSLWHNAGKQSHAATLWELSQGLPELVRELPDGDVVLTAAAPGLFDDSPERRSAWRAARVALLAKPDPRRPIAATAIARAAGTDDKAEPVEEAPPWRRGRAGTSIGRAVHSTLQTIDLDTGDHLGQIASAQAAAEGVPGRAAEVTRLVEAARQSECVRAAVASGRYWREVYVSALVGANVVEGFIDLLYETPEGLVVVDYKTDSVASDLDPAQALGRYRLQGAAYALALQQTLGQPVARVVFLFVRATVPRQVEVSDLAAVMAELESSMAAGLTAQLRSRRPI